jgi:sialate O-acetylesterase
MHYLTLVAAASITTPHPARSPPSALKLPALLSDDGLLAAAPRTAKVWGWSPAGDKVTVAFAGPALTGTYTAVATSTDGRWEVTLPPVQPSLNTSDLTISTSSNASASITISRLLFGDVLLCGEQSNMQFSLNLAFNGTAAIASVGHSFPYGKLHVCTIQYM